MKKSKEIKMDAEVFQPLSKDQIKAAIEWRSENITTEKDNLKSYINDRELLEYYVNHESGIFTFITEASLKYKKGKNFDTLELLLKLGEKEIKFKFRANIDLFNEILGEGIKKVLLRLVSRVKGTEYRINKYEKEIDYLSKKEPTDVDLFDGEDPK